MSDMLSRILEFNQKHSIPTNKLDENTLVYPIIWENGDCPQYISLKIEEDIKLASVFGIDFCQFPSGRQDDMCEIANQLNSHRRLSKYVVNEETNTVFAVYETPIFKDHEPSDLVSLVFRMYKEIKNDLPQFKKLLPQGEQ